MIFWRKIIHFVSTAWFISAIFYVLTVALRQWGLKWWVIFSVSSYSFILVAILVSFYLFALYRGLVRGKAAEMEHPLTKSNAYMTFYDINPLLGGISGLIASAGLETQDRVLSMTAMGTFASTFFVWVALDPLIGFVETFLPESAKLRKSRLEIQRQQKSQEQLDRKRILQEAFEKQAKFVELCKVEFVDDAKILRDLLLKFNGFNNENYTKIVEIGLKAWKKGGFDAMKHLYNLAAKDLPATNGLGHLWEGIGNWKK